jgi:alcohol dehydrogenase class IV
VTSSPCEFCSPKRIRIGPGVADELPEVLGSFGRRVFLVTGANPERHDSLTKALRRARFELENLAIVHEPTIDDVQQGVEMASVLRADVVVGLGGGSAMDAAKAIAGVAGNDGALLDYLEVVGRGKALPNDGLPFVAVPTTAGTGAEATRNAVLDVPAQAQKVSLRSPRLLAAVALVDPRLTLGLPRELTRSSGMDALTQLIEPYVCNAQNPLTDALAREGLERVARSLRRVCEHPSDLEARTDMSYASLLSGLCLGNARLGAVHGLAGPLGGMFRAPHGAVCAALLAPVMRANIAALRAQEPNSPTLGRYATVARLLSGNPEATPEDGVKWVDRLAKELGVEPLSSFGIDSQRFASVIEKASRASSMKGNPVVLEPARLGDILRSAL